MVSGAHNDKTTADKNHCVRRNLAGCCNVVGDVQMSEYIELINPKTRICKLLKNGEVVAEYKMEQCDKCSMLARVDEFGYQRGQAGEKLLWFCGGCR
jgi:hypothetical protein